MDTWFLILTLAIPWVGALFVWRISDEHPRFQNAIAVIFSVAAGITALLLIPYASDKIILTIPVGGVFGDFTFVADGLGVFLAAVATVIGSLAVIFSIDYMRGEHQLGRYYSLVLLFIGAMAGLVLTNNMLVMFFYWEITALCSYALISFNNDDPKAVAGGIKALIMTQIGGIGLLVGALVVKGTLGTYDTSALIGQASKLPASALGLIAFGFLIAAAAKSAQFPFQTWLPDAMEAPTPISALIHAATMVNAGVYLLVRFYPAFQDVPGWRTAVVIVGAVSALITAVMALAATDLKRVLAYSTVSQLGYMVYAIGCGGVFASQFHLLSHSVFKALLFLGAGAVIHSVGTRDMRKMGGLGEKMPLVRTVFVIGGLALAGLPILNGFWSKEKVLEAGVAGGPFWAYIVMLLVAGLTALYTYRCVYLVFYGKPRSALHGHDAQTAMKISLIVLAAGTFLTELLAGPFAQMLESTLPFHHVEAGSTLLLLEEVILDPYTLLALAVIAVGLALWAIRDRLKGLIDALQGFSRFAADGLGFESINRGVVRATQGIAEALRVTQTGQLNWNVFGILGGFVILVAILAMGV